MNLSVNTQLAVSIDSFGRCRQYKYSAIQDRRILVLLSGKVVDIPKHVWNELLMKNCELALSDEPSIDTRAQGDTNQHTD